ncbi:MAG: hypothetical protein CMD39_03595 [Gammaproteobacteria bacterium]|nr:hypothetical protein [Gammaproteobacteria bacterium]
MPARRPRRWRGRRASISPATRPSPSTAHWAPTGTAPARFSARPCARRRGPSWNRSATATSTTAPTCGSTSSSRPGRWWSGSRTRRCPSATACFTATTACGPATIRPPRQYTQGTLHVDVVDAGLDQMIWEGIAESRRRDGQFTFEPENARKAVARVFADFPRRTP